MNQGNRLPKLKVCQGLLNMTPNVVFTVYELSSSELFLFLRDNALIQRFAQYENLQLSVMRASEAPQSPFQTSQPGDENRMVLVAKGRNESCNTLREVLDERRKVKLHPVTLWL